MSQFDDAHRRALREAARRRSEDQEVGKYIRACNKALFATLLLESKNPNHSRIPAVLEAWGLLANSRRQLLAPGDIEKRSPVSPTGKCRSGVDAR